jgi:hypothetical protein
MPKKESSQISPLKSARKTAWINTIYILRITDGGAETMTEPYKDVSIIGGTEPILETLLGRINGWYDTGNIDYRRADRSLVELMRFRLACMNLRMRKLRSGSALN